MKHEATRELFRYWNGLRGARTAPERSDIEPTAIRAILPDTFMLDVAATFPVRLAGTRVNALLDAERRGGFLELWRAEERHNLAAVLDAVVDSAGPIVIGAAGAPVGREDCSFEMLFLPLRHFGKTHSRILGIVTPSRPPSWLGLAPMAPLALRSLRVIGADELGRVTPPRLADEMRPAGPRRDAARGFEAVARRDVPAMAPPIPGRPSLRLIEGGLAG